MLAAGSPARVLLVVYQPAAGEGLVDLGVEVVAIGENEKRVIPAKLAVHLAREKRHRIRLAGTLRVPEHAELALPHLPLTQGLNGPVHAEELVVARKDLR